MRCDIYVAGVGVSIPPATPVEVAIAEGRYDRQEANRSRQLAATVAPDDEGVHDLAVAAATRALEHAGTAAGDIGLVLHTSVWDTGFDVWNPAAYIQRELDIPTGTGEVAEIRSGCAGSLLALRWSCLHLQSQQARPAALVTAADCWRPPTIDRWRSDPQTVMGDAGGALVLSRSPGFARVASVCSYTDPNLEELARGNEPFRPLLHPERKYPLDMSSRARAFMRTKPVEEIQRRFNEGVSTVINNAVTEAGIELRDIDHLVLPFLGWHSLKPIYFDRLGLDVERTTFEYSRRIGHTGAGDPFIGMEQLVRSERLKPGDWVLLVAAGVGFVWTAAVLQATGA